MDILWNVLILLLVLTILFVCMVAPRMLNRADRTPFLENTTLTEDYLIIILMLLKTHWLLSKKRLMQAMAKSLMFN